MWKSLQLRIKVRGNDFFSPFKNKIGSGTSGLVFFVDYNFYRFKGAKKYWMCKIISGKLSCSIEIFGIENKNAVVGAHIS